MITQAVTAVTLTADQNTAEDDDRPFDRSHRLLCIIRVLAETSTGFSQSELARALGVSRPTVLRDIELLTDVVLVYEEPGPRGAIHYRLSADGIPPPIRRLVWPDARLT